MSTITQPEHSVPAAESTLSVADRCDSCGAQAYIRVVLATGDLLFCAHHGSGLREQLEPKALEWHDETFKLHQ